MRLGRVYAPQPHPDASQAYRIAVDRLGLADERRLSRQGRDGEADRAEQGKAYQEGGGAAGHPSMSSNAE